MEKEILLSSGLTQEAFGKTNLGAMINEKGLVFDVGASTGSTGSQTVATSVPEHVEGWAFSKTFLSDDGDICFSGGVLENEDFELFSLADVFDFGEERAGVKKDAVFSLVKFLTESISERRRIPNVGFGGVYFVAVGSSAAISKIIFLPEEIFSRCAACQDEKSMNRLIGTSVKKGLGGDGAVAFLRAATIYRFLTKKDAYTSENPQNRNIDMIDGIFIPLLVAVAGVPEKICASVDSALKINGDFVKKSKGTKKMEEAAIRDFPLDDFLSLDVEKTKIVDGETIGAVEKKIKRVASVNRFLRRNKKSILAGVAAIFVALYVFNSFHKTNLELATSKGCTPEETAKILYQGINDADVTIVQEVAKGRKIKDLETMIVGIRVNYKSHQAMEENAGNYTPELWLSRKGKSNFWIYGVTNLEIEGEKTVLDGNYPRRKDKMKSLELPKSTSTTVNTKYFLVHSESDYTIKVFETEEKLTLTWKRNRWVVTEINGTTRQKTYETKKFREDYTKALEENNDDVVLATDSLQFKYNWLPKLN